MNVQPLRVGFLHIGPSEHGVCRYGRLLAAEATTRPELIVRSHSVVLTEEPSRNHHLLQKAAQAISTSHVVHFQFTENIWGENDDQWKNIWTFLRYCHCPKIVTLHDTEYDESVSASPACFIERGYTAWRQLKHTIRIALMKAGGGRHFSPSNAWMRAWLVQEVHTALVCTREEFRRLGVTTQSGDVVVVPHFVEERSIQMDRRSVRRILGVEGRQVITLLGFIYGGKGHDLLLRAAPLLPESVVIVFAGGSCAGAETYLDELRQLAANLRIQDRVCITGYLSEAELEQYILATDLAVCPFYNGYASGSLSTWISACRTILASDLPLFHEYNQIEPGAIRLFAPMTPEALAQAIQTILSGRLPIVDPLVARLRDRLAMPVIFNQHLIHYERAASQQHTCRS